LDKATVNDSKTTVRELLSTFYGITGDYELYTPDSKPIILIKISGERFAFKFHNELIRPNIAKISQLYSVCSENGFTPRLTLTREGDCIGTSAGNIFSLQKYLKNDTINYNSMEVLSKRLAELHNLFVKMKDLNIDNHLSRTVCNIRESASKYEYHFLLSVVDEVEAVLENSQYQLTHGDLHSGNMILHQGDVFFIDLDSANTFVSISDVAFTAFRVFDGDPSKMEGFVEAYNAHNPPHLIERHLIRSFIIYNILQRILFILIERDGGHRQWMIDLDNQKRFLNTAMKMN